MPRPDPNSVDAQGFEAFLHKDGKLRPGSETGFSSGRWPTSDEVAGVLKKTGVADVQRTPLQFLDPAYFDPLLFWIQHRDRKELNFRLRHAVEYEPIVGNLIDLHRTMPLSDYSLVCKDKSVERDFQEFADDIELLPTSSYILSDFLSLGEAIVQKQWDQYDLRWKQITLLPPEKVELRRTYLTKDPLMFLQVDSELKRLVNSADPIDEAIVQQLDPDLVDKIKTEDRIPLPPHLVDHFANKTSMTDLRGTSILKRALYAILIKYKIRLLHSTYLDRAAFPIVLWKLGHAESKWIPSRAHFEALRNSLAAACFSEDTEVLTENGFKFHWEVQPGERLATVDPSTGALSYALPVRKMLYDWDDKGPKIADQGATDCTVDEVRAWARELSARHEGRVPERVYGLSTALIQEFWTAFLEGRKVTARPRKKCQEVCVRCHPLARDLAVLLARLGYWTRVRGQKGAHFLQFRAPTPNLVHFKTRSMDCLVTGNHEMLVRSFRGAWRKARADSISAQTQFRGAIDTWRPDGAPPDVVRLGPHEFRLLDFVKLVGYAVSEGYARDYSLTLTQKTDPNHPAYIDMATLQTVTAGGVSQRRRTMQTQLKGRAYTLTATQFYFWGKELADWMTENLGRGAKNKQLPSWIKNLPREYLIALLGAMINGDGTVQNAATRAGGNGPRHVNYCTRYRYYTSSPQLARDVQEICLKLGWGSACWTRRTEHPNDAGRELKSFVVSIKPPRGKGEYHKHPVVFKPKHIRQVPYVGRVFCFEVPPHHTVVTRRNGRVLVTFQSNDPSHCFSGDTELLTENGWKHYWEIKPEEKLATLEPQTGALEYRAATAWNVQDYAGDMVHFSSRSIDLLVTPEHKVWVQPIEDRLRNGTPRSYPWRFKAASEMTGSYRMRSVPEKWEGIYVCGDPLAPEVFDQPEFSEHPGGGTAILAQTGVRKMVRFNKFILRLDDLVQLAGFYISEGCVWKADGYVTRPWRLQISQNAGPSPFNSTMRILGARVPFRITESVSRSMVASGHIKYCIYEPGVPEFFRDQFGQGSVNKRIPKWMKMLPRAYLRLLLDALIAGDGTVRMRGDTTSYVYYTSSPRLAEDVREVALKLGWHTSVRELPVGNGRTVPHYHVCIAPSPQRARRYVRGALVSIARHMIRRVSYSGKVFCPNVPPYHLVFARRNGKVVVSGNSLIWHFGLNVEVIGVKEKWEDLIRHYAWADKEIMAALFGNEAFVHGQGTTYSNANVSVRVLMSRYQTIRTYLELLWRNRVFKPMAEQRGYWVTDTTGNTGSLPTRRHQGRIQYLDVPHFRWAKLNLLDDTAQKQFLMRLREKLEIPHKTIADIFGLDENELREALKSEEGTVVDPVWIEARRKASGQPVVMSQVLQGRKSKEWVLERSTPEDEAKRKERGRQPGGPIEVGAPVAGLGANPPGIEPPGGMRSRPPGAPSGPGAPPLSPPTEPGQGVTSPPL